MTERRIVCFEKYGSSSSRRKYMMETEYNRLRIVEVEKSFSNMKSFFMSVFLPQGFPESVSSDYLPYQFWDSIQAFASSITGTLSTHAVLKGVGVGDESATPIAATMTWLLKDGTGMLGRILFAWINGSSFDSDPKKWRLFADFLNDFAIFIDLISPKMKAFFIPIMCISAVSKSLVGVAGGATRAALTQHQARRNNMADVSAKDGSQETLVNLCALLCSLVIMPIVADNQTLIWCLYALLTVLHLYANYNAVSAVVMDTFNIERFQIFVNHYLCSGFELLSKSEVNRRESLWILPWTNTMKIGISLAETLEGYCNLYTLQNLYKDALYLLNIKRSKTSSVQIRITLHEDSNVQTQLEALFQACVLQHVLQRKKIKQEKIPWQLQAFPEQLTKDNSSTILKMSRDFTMKNFPILMESLSKLEWNISHVLFRTDEWRAAWNTDYKEVEML